MISIQRVALSTLVVLTAYTETNKRYSAHLMTNEFQSQGFSNETDNGKSTVLKNSII